MSGASLGSASIARASSNATAYAWRLIAAFSAASDGRLSGFISSIIRRNRLNGRSSAGRPRPDVDDQPRPGVEQRAAFDGGGDLRGA